MDTPASRTSKLPRPQINPGSSPVEQTSDTPGKPHLIILENFNKFVEEIRGHEYNLEQTVPAKVPKSRTIAINEAMNCMKLLYLKISRAFGDLSARYQELFALKNQFALVISLNISDIFQDEMASVKQLIKDSIDNEVQKVICANAQQQGRIENNVIKKVVDSVSNSISSFEDSVTTKLLPSSRSYASAVTDHPVHAAPLITISKKRSIAVSNFKEFIVEPLASEKTTFPNSTAVKNVLLSRIHPRKYNIRPHLGPHPAANRK